MVGALRRRDLAALSLSFLLAPSGAAAAVSEDGRGQDGRHLLSSQPKVIKGRTPLQLYRRRARGGPASRPVLLLAHGSTIAAQASYDLQVPGGVEYSMMTIFARRGFDVWAIDFDGYGRSGWSGGNSDITDGARDLALATDLIRRETGERAVHLFGQSSGALRAGVFAMNHPDRVRSLVLESFTWTGEGSPTIADRRRRVDEYRANPRRKRDRDSLMAIFTRDQRDAFDPAVAEAIIATELPLGGLVPSGTYLDMAVNLPLVDPPRLTCPVLIARGARDGIATEQDLLNFFARLPNADRHYASFANAAHGLVVGAARQALFRTIDAFLGPPAGRALA